MNIVEELTQAAEQCNELQAKMDRLAKALPDGATQETCLSVVCKMRLAANILRVEADILAPTICSRCGEDGANRGLCSGCWETTLS